MFVNAPTSPYQGDNAGRGPSGGVWWDLPENYRDPSIAVFDESDYNDIGDYPSTSGAAFTSATSGAWCGFTTYGYQGATAIDAGVAGGALTIASDGDNEGLYISRLCAPFKIASTTKKLIGEFRIATSTITDTKHNLFVGMMEPLAAATGTPISTADALVDKNLFGFIRCADATAGNGSVLHAVYKKAGQTAQQFTTAGVAAIDLTNITTAKMATLVAATYVKVGFRFDPNLRTDRQLKIYVNGVEVAGAIGSATNIAAATFPSDKFMTFVFGVLNATGTTPGTSSIDWHRIVQLI